MAERKSILDVLSERQIQILRLTYVPGEHKPYTAQEVADQLGLSRKTIVRDLAAALDAIRDFAAEGNPVYPGDIF